MKMQEQLKPEQINLLKKILAIYKSKKETKSIEEYLKKIINACEKVKVGYEDEDLFFWYR